MLGEGVDDGGRDGNEIKQNNTTVTLWLLQSGSDGACALCAR